MTSKRILIGWRFLLLILFSVILLFGCGISKAGIYASNKRESYGVSFFKALNKADPYCNGRRSHIYQYRRSRAYTNEDYERIGAADSVIVLIYHASPLNYDWEMIKTNLGEYFGYTTATRITTGVQRISDKDIVNEFSFLKYPTSDYEAIKDGEQLRVDSPSILDGGWITMIYLVKRKSGYCYKRIYGEEECFFSPEYYKFY